MNQVIFDYSDCFQSATTTFSPAPSENGAIQEWKYDPVSKNCTVRFKTTVNFDPPVFIYYRLTNFYQNHRRYVKSFDAYQLKGDLIENASSLTSTCDPFRSAKDVEINGTKIYKDNAQYYPCGLIANSFFSGKFASDFKLQFELITFR